MGHYKKYSGGNHHLRMDMDHERRLIHDAKDDIYKEDRDLRDRKSAAHQEGVEDLDTKDVKSQYMMLEEIRDIGRRYTYKIKNQI